MAKTPPRASQFASLSKLRDRQPVTPETPPAIEAPTPIEPPPAPVAAEVTSAPQKRMGRPPGKKSSPDYEQTTLILRKASKREAMRHTLESGLDLSTLVNVALDEWLDRQRSKA